MGMVQHRGTDEGSHMGTHGNHLVDGSSPSAGNNDHTDSSGMPKAAEPVESKCPAQARWCGVGGEGTGQGSFSSSSCLGSILGLVERRGPFHDNLLL